MINGQSVFSIRQKNNIVKTRRSDQERFRSNNEHERGADVMAPSKRRVDRRIQRTRQVLQQAFLEVMREKGFAATSIQEITEQANVSRGTFYLHFADKYVLVDTLVREGFQRLLANALPSDSRWERKTLRVLIQTLLRYFESKYHHQHHLPGAVTPLVERAIHEELTKRLFTWLKQSTSQEMQGLVPMETVARAVSWAILGTVLQWSQEESTTSLEQMADAILLVVLGGVTQLAPNALPE
jgi:AcrR family transcriptional regulator